MSTISPPPPSDPRVQSGSNDELIEQAKQGSEDACRQLVVEYHSRVRLYFARHLRCDSEVDDLSQEVFIVALNRLQHFEGKSSFSTWLLGIARNKLLQHFADTKKTRQGLHDVASWKRHCQEDPATLAKLATEHETYLAALNHCLDELPQRSRDLIEQFYFEQRASHEIAAEQARSSSAIRMMLKRIRQLLQDCIQSKRHTTVSLPLPPQPPTELS